MPADAGTTARLAEPGILGGMVEPDSNRNERARAVAPPAGGAVPPRRPSDASVRRLHERSGIFDRVDGVWRRRASAGAAGRLPAQLAALPKPARFANIAVAPASTGTRWHVRVNKSLLRPGQTNFNSITTWKIPVPNAKRPGRREAKAAVLYASSASRSRPHRVLSENGEVRSKHVSEGYWALNGTSKLSRR